MNTGHLPNTHQNVIPAVRENEPMAAPPTALTSDSLLRGQKAVAISHNGAIYRLQATRQGKLILTK